MWRHQVGARAAFDFREALQQLGTDGASLGFLILGALEAFYDRVRNMNAEKVVVHPARRPGRCQWTDADQEMGLLEIGRAHV